MENLDKLIEYYFQRKIAGFGTEDIRKSLEGQRMDDDERLIILNQVQRLEHEYRQALARQRYGRYITVGGAVVATMAVVVFYLSFALKADYSLYISMPLLLLGSLGAVSGYSLSKKRTSLRRVR